MVLLAIQLTSSKCPMVCGFRNGSGIAPLSGASPGPGRFLVEFRLTSTRAAPYRADKKPFAAISLAMG